MFHTRTAACFLNNFIEISLLHGCSPVNLQYICGTLFYETSNFLSQNFKQEPTSLKVHSWVKNHFLIREIELFLINSVIITL